MPPAILLMLTNLLPFVALLAMHQILAQSVGWRLKKV